ncbi:MAG: winged helix-turn-helix domain-containing protein [Edaphobacter sp.]|uniref:winged helix-turn-helix domain-containing protein n=1 Tax=Edaphobacter sp. TaxID=1934404 RepID=UPI002393E323|nr:winged helix-turn-helix domain-containing protein [Edaphobacter sp.]MDE1176389.1 winged helix-turn-helix domain-containing protein [Edaphobacter sp.]
MSDRTSLPWSFSAINPTGASFGLFEVNFERQELLKAGRRIHLQTQPFLMLLALLEHPGTIITKDELRRRIWGEATNVDFDQSLSKAINKVREALGDSSDNPHFIETIPRRGYRFIAPVALLERQLPRSAETDSSNLTENVVLEVVSVASPIAELQAGPRLDGHSRSTFLGLQPRNYFWALCAIGILLVGAGLGDLLARRSDDTPPPAMRQLTFDTRVGVSPHTKGMEGFPSLVTDGESLFTSGYDSGSFALLQTSVNGKELRKVTIPKEIVSPQIGAVSRHTSRLLLNSASSIWILPLDGSIGTKTSGSRSARRDVDA